MNVLARLNNRRALTAVERIAELRDELQAIKEPQQLSDLHVELQRLRHEHARLAKVGSTDAAKDAARAVADQEASIKAFEAKHSKRLTRALDLANELTIAIRDAKQAMLPSLVASVHAGQTALRKMDEARRAAADELAAEAWACSLFARNCGAQDPYMAGSSVLPHIEARAVALLDEMLAKVNGE
jgi:hypothetical protein